jgi:hypothetical protein
MFTKEQLKKIRQNLPYGSYTLISAKCNCTYEEVRNTLHGRSTNLLILEEAIKIAEVHKQKVMLIKKKMDKINK